MRINFLSLFFGSWLIASIVILLSGVQYPKVAVDPKEIPDQFPIVVVSHNKGNEYHSAIVWKADFESYTSKLPNYSIRIPVSKKKLLDKQVDESAHIHLSVPGRFEVQPLPDGKQSVIVTGTWHQGLCHETGWYVVDSEKLIPQYYRSSATGIFAKLHASMSGFVAAAAICLVAIVAKLIKYLMVTIGTKEHSR